jgi:hypothetical protein
MYDPVLSELEITGQVVESALHMVVEILIFAVTGLLPLMRVVSWVIVHLVTDVFQMARVQLVLVQTVILHSYG